MRLFSTIAVLALLLGAPALAETSVGVTAAVNPDATGTVGSTVRTISLGDSVVFNQRIETGGTGLVQVLLADGTTFMVGPNSNLVIDSFVYDPNAGTAQVTASFTKGVLRFIGGQTSKTEGGVTINTPVGTMGIRGAMVDIVLDPPEGTPPHIDMLFGNEVTLEQGQQLLGRLYAAGYSLALGPNGTFDVLKTPPGWGSQIQAALAGKAGATGGAPKGPSDGDVKNSEVANNNSGKGPDKGGNRPLSQAEINALLYAAAHYDEIKQQISDGAVVSVKAAYAGGVLTANYNGEPEVFGLDHAFYGETGGPALAEVGYDAQGNPRGIDHYMSELGSGGTEGHVHIENGVASFDNTEPGDPPTQGLPGTGSVSRGDIDPLELPECECSFIDWGYWSFNVQASQGSDSIDVGVTDGTWVSGDLTSVGDLDGLQASETAVATYKGIAVGTVTNAAGTDIRGEVGDLYMLWSFSNREGIIEISNFDGKTLDGRLGLAQGENSFGGWLDEQGAEGIGAAYGSFVDDQGAMAAAGVIGFFGFKDYESDWYASGIFLGGRDEDVAGLPGAFFGGVYTGQMECEYQDCVQPSAPGVNAFDYEYGEAEYPYVPDLLAFTPTLASLKFDENDQPISIDATFMATIHCDDDCYYDGEAVTIVYNGDGTTGTLAMDLPFEGPTRIDTTLNYLFAYNDPSEANPLNGVPNEYYPSDTYADQLDCDACNDFIKWGFWGFSAENLQVGDVTGDVDYQGAWIHGDLTTRAQMANLATLNQGNYQATYTGDAVGMVYNADVGEGGSTYLATGDLAMTYNFGLRQGTVDISGFDAEHRGDIYEPGIDIHYGIDGPTTGSNGFIGFMGSEGYGGAVQGAFVNDGPNAAAGVIGNFSYSEGFDAAPSYTASGVFMGVRPTN